MCASSNPLDFLTPAERRAWADYLTTYAGFQQVYKDFPAAFADQCFHWPVGQSLKPYQRDVFDHIPLGRVCVRAPHSVGKTTVAAITIIWFALTRDRWSDWKVVTTAGVNRQLKEFLWPEVHKWARLLRWDRIHRPPFRHDELLDMALNLDTGSAFAASSDNPMQLEGAHAERILYLFDESKLIKPAIFDAAEGALAQGDLPDHEALALALSTPGAPIGRFYDIQKRKPGFADWWVRHITMPEAVAAGQMSQAWVSARALMWGIESAQYKNRVQGDFAADDERGVIPLSWIEAANRRWLDWQDRSKDAAYVMPPVKTIGADIADSGDDSTVKAYLIDETSTIESTIKGEPPATVTTLTVISAIDRLPFHTDPMETAGNLAGALNAHPSAKAIIDGIGIGSPVVARLKELSKPAYSFIASHATPVMDRSNAFYFHNLRAAGWWGLRERLDPSSPLPPVALPPDDLLTGDLTTPRWRETSDATILIESKEDIKKRLGRSTDTGDAVVHAISAHLVGATGTVVGTPIVAEHTSLWKPDLGDAGGDLHPGLSGSRWRI